MGRVINRRRVLGGKKGKLPRDYTELDYLRVTHSFFRTDFIPTKGCRVEIKWKGVGNNSNIAGILFGCRTGYNNSMFVFQTSKSSYASEELKFYLGYDKGRKLSTIDIYSKEETVYGVDNGRFYLNDIIIAEYTDDFSPSFPLFLLLTNNAGTPLGTPPTGNLYYCKCWDDDGILVREYIPAIRNADNTFGLFDIVNQQFIIKG